MLQSSTEDSFQNVLPWGSTQPKHGPKVCIIYMLVPLGFELTSRVLMSLDATPVLAMFALMLRNVRGCPKQNAEVQVGSLGPGHQTSKCQSQRLQVSSFIGSSEGTYAEGPSKAPKGPYQKSCGGQGRYGSFPEFGVPKWTPIFHK